MKNLKYCIKHCDSKLRTLFNEYNNENSLQIDKFYEVIRKYNLKDALQVITSISQLIYRQEKSLNNFRPFGLVCNNNEILTTMSILADVTYHLIMSGSNDKNNAKLSDNGFYNAIVLSRLSHFHLDNKRFKDETFNIYNILQILAKEQGQMQLPIVPAIARNYVLFDKIVKSDWFYQKRSLVNKEIFTSFEQFLGMSFQEYFKITFLILVFLMYDERKTLDPKILFELNIDEKIFTFERIKNLIEYLSVSYQDFKTLANQTPGLNPLYKKPIIKFDDTRYSKYTCPNISILFEKCWNGLFYDIEDYFKKQNPDKTIRDQFGYVFEEYVGLLLKETLPDLNLRPGITYKRNGTSCEFFDWILQYNRNGIEEYYLIEVKSSEVPTRYWYDKNLHEYYKKDVISKLSKTIEKLDDINKTNELEFLKNKTIYPVFVFKDLPFVNSTIIKELLQSCTDENSKLCEMIKNNSIYIFNIDAFENFTEMLKYNNFNIKWLFEEQYKLPGENLNSIMQKHFGKELLRNSYLASVFDDLFKDFPPSGKKQ